MQKILLLTAVLCLSLSQMSTTAAASKSRKKAKVEKSDTVAKKKVTKYDKTFVKDKSCVTAKAEGGFMTLHKSKGKLYIELPVKNMGREMLIASTISEASDPDLGSIGYKPQPPMHVRFNLIDSTVYMTEVSVLPDYDTSDKQMAHAVKLSSMDPILNAYKIVCFNNDSTAVVFDASNLFTTNYEPLAPIKSGSMGGINITASFNSSGSALGDIKAFKDNVSIKSMLSYTVSANLMQLVLLKKNDPFTVGVTRSILMLPEQKMRPRIADSRVGIFLSGRTDLNPDADQIARYSVIHRWNIQPSDSAAWARGEVVDPVKPIVFYLDDAFPALWREPAKEGIERWNKAFEKIGFKNVVQVRDFPKDDPEFDPDNLKYSCIRYVPAQITNAMGPSWVDPSSGEIINASIIVYNDIIKLINNWRFCQTAQVDPRVRSKRMPEDVVRESVAYILAHEAGHCLGFMHNMAASSAYAVDSLRSATFTQKYGTTPSIMDYARFNYVAQPGDKGVKLTPPDLGIYDEFLIQYAYKPIIGAKDAKDEVKTLEKWVDEKAGDPRFRYGRQQVIQRYDPSAIEEDLGDDPIKAADYGTKNLKYILAHFNEWMPDATDPDAALRTARYEELAKQYNRYIRAVMLNIGGIYLTEVKAGTPGKNVVPVDKKRQRAALQWVLKQLKECDWIADRDLTDRFSLRVELPPIFQYYTALEFYDTYKNVILSSHVAESPKDAYTIRNWADDMYEGIWESAIKRRQPTAGDRIMQNLYANFLTTAVTKKGSLTKVSTGKSFAGDNTFMPSVDHIVAFGLDESGVVAKNIGLLRDLEIENGYGYVASQVLTDFGKPGYGWQYRVNLRSIDESKTIFYGETQRIIRLLKACIPASTGDARIHYQSVLYQLERALNKD